MSCTRMVIWPGLNPGCFTWSQTLWPVCRVNASANIVHKVAVPLFCSWQWCLNCVAIQIEIWLLLNLVAWYRKFLRDTILQKEVVQYFILSPVYYPLFLVADIGKWSMKLTIFIIFWHIKQDQIFQTILINSSGF